MLHNKNPRAPGRSLTSSESFAVFFGVLNGLRYLHKHNLTVNGLCPRNILLGRESHQGVVKLVGNIRKNFRIDNCGELLPYLPPEVLFNEEWSFAADMYGLAMSVWESVQEDQYPFGRESNIHQCVYEKDRPEFEDSAPAWVKECAARCWDDLPSSRPTADQLFSDFNRHVTDHGDPSQNILGIFNKGKKKNALRARAVRASLKEELSKSAKRSSATTSRNSRIKSRQSSANGRPPSFTSSIFSMDNSRGHSSVGKQGKHEKTEGSVRPRMLGSGGDSFDGDSPKRRQSGSNGSQKDEDEDGANLGWQSPLPPPRPVWKGARNGTRNARSIMLMLGVKNPRPPNLPVPPPPLPPRPPELD